MDSKKTSKTAKSLVDFVKAKKRANCPVCALSDAILAELADARTKKITRGTQLDWLQAEHHVKLTSALLDAHYSGRHEQ